MTTATPPRWAEVVLGLLLAPHDRQTVSGDLLEEYRESIHPARGRHLGDVWYLSQVAGFAWRANGTCAVLLAGAFVARSALDWLLPTADFHTRSTGASAAGGSRRLARRVGRAVWRHGPPARIARWHLSRSRTHRALQA